MFNATLDTDLDTRMTSVCSYVKTSDGTTWTDGGVGRISTHESIHPDTDWTWSTVIDGIGPSSAVTKLQNNSDAYPLGVLRHGKVLL
jgi:hypothetical protein